MKVKIQNEVRLLFRFVNAFKKNSSYLAVRESITTHHSLALLNWHDLKEISLKPSLGGDWLHLPFLRIVSWLVTSSKPS